VLLDADEPLWRFRDAPRQEVVPNQPNPPDPAYQRIVPGREPSPRELKALVTEGRQGGLGRLFTEPQFPPAAARVVANEAGLDLTLVDPIGGVPGRATYPELMRFNADAFVRGLSGAAKERP